MDCPTSLKSVKPYLDRASEVQAKDPIVAYHCRLFALQEAMKLRASVPKADMGFVLSLMDQCEKEKGALGEMDEPAITVENFAQDLFQRADDADRAGRSDLRTGKAFLAASHIFDVCKQFEELPADISEKAKYAKWRFVEIAKAALIPALLYFGSVFWMVHLEAKRAGLKGLPKDECPSAWAAVKERWYLLIPLLVLVWLLFSGRTPMFAGTIGGFLAIWYAIGFVFGGS